MKGSHIAVTVFRLHHYALMALRSELSPIYIGFCIKNNTVLMQKLSCFFQFYFKKKLRAYAISVIKSCDYEHSKMQ